MRLEAPKQSDRLERAAEAAMLYLAWGPTVLVAMRVTSVVCVSGSNNGGHMPGVSVQATQQTNAHGRRPDGSGEDVMLPEVRWPVL